MDETPTCLTCNYWKPYLPQAQEAGENTWPRVGKCRRYPPLAGDPATDASDSERHARYVQTAPEEWCGEYCRREAAFASQENVESVKDTAEERMLRNAAIAQALMVLPQEKQDKLLSEVLTEEERQSPFPPDDLYERVTRYFQLQKEATPN